jgi:hypothetical protein
MREKQWERERERARATETETRTIVDDFWKSFAISSL